eukprot:GHVP01001010.1.p3 GENE.GHVP01001010.1~~GHVP01001010.1.p3  ORF type:complete len:110 (+),score=23.11 GHVP01001010.1:1782-2111(+)
MQERSKKRKYEPTLLEQWSTSNKRHHTDITKKIADKANASTQTNRPLLKESKNITATVREAEKPQLSQGGNTNTTKQPTQSSTQTDVKKEEPAPETEVKLDQWKKKRKM